MEELNPLLAQLRDLNARTQTLRGLL
jgi:hypothetical protein